MNKSLFSFLLLAAILLTSCQPTSAGSASIGDLTWLDANANGIQDAGEEGLADVTVRLYDASGTQMAKTRSDSEGRYAFADLRPGDYTLEFIAPAGYTLTKADQGKDDARDSDPAPASGRTAVISLAAGQAAADWDAGFVPKAAALPTETPTQTLTPTPAGPPPAEEIVIHGKSGDLQSRYYRAATEPAPLVVLMHGGSGDMNDWNEVAVWLQNRGLKNPYPNPGDAPRWDPSWFPPLPEGRSYAVLTFTYEGCQPYPVGCPQELDFTTVDTWVLNSMDAVYHAGELPGVNPNRIVAIGVGVGPINGCSVTPHCLGALSLSPDSFMEFQDQPQTVYSQALKFMFKDNPDAKTLCLANETEIENCDGVLSARYPNHRAIEIPGGGHGTELLQPNLTPLPMRLILDFLALVFGE